MRPFIIAVAVALFACSAATAQAGSIAYVKDGDVWLSTDDGGRQFRVTDRGGYHDVTQSDDGTLVATTGVRLHRLDRLGNVLADFDTPVSDTRPPGQRTFFGPYDIALSPNGRKLSYTYYYMTQSQNQTCYPPECVTAINEGGTGYSHPDRQTGWDEDGYRYHSGWRNGIWADDDTTILTDPTHLPNADVIVDKPAERDGGGFLVKNWFTDDVQGNPGVGAGDITRDKSKLTLVTGEADSTLTFYAVGTFPTTWTDSETPDKPTVCYRYSGANGGRYGSPTFSPDGSRAAFEEGDGVHVVSVPDFSAGCTTAGASPNTQELIPGARRPDWGPADVPLARPEAGGGAGSGSGGSGGGTGGGNGGAGAGPGAGQPGAAPTLAVARAKLRRALAKGLAVTLRGARPGRVTLKATYRGRVVARATGTVAADGQLKARLRFTRAARRSLRRARSLKLVVTGAGASTRVTLRR